MRLETSNSAARRDSRSMDKQMTPSNLRTLREQLSQLANMILANAGVTAAIKDTSARINKPLRSRLSALMDLHEPALSATRRTAPQPTILGPALLRVSRDWCPPRTQRRQLNVLITDVAVPDGFAGLADVHDGSLT